MYILKDVVVLFVKYLISMHKIKWGGRNQEGAGTTLGEEVEQVNSFLSRTAICSKYMTKGGKCITTNIYNAKLPNGTQKIHSFLNGISIKLLPDT